MLFIRFIYLILYQSKFRLSTILRKQIVDIFGLTVGQDIDLSLGGHAGFKLLLALLLDKSQVPLPPNSDGRFLFGRYSQTGNIVVALQLVPQAIILIKNVLLHFHVLSSFASRFAAPVVVRGPGLP